MANEWHHGWLAWLAGISRDVLMLITYVNTPLNVFSEELWLLGWMGWLRPGAMMERRNEFHSE
jgi:hypothetical protein